MCRLYLVLLAVSVLVPGELAAQFEDLVIDDLRLDVRIDHDAARLEGVARLRRGESLDELVLSYASAR